MARRSDLDGVPGVAGVLTPRQCRQTAESIAAVQEPSGEIPWSEIGHTDVWDHVECAMALTVAGLTEQARAAYDWCRREQRADGSWPIQYRRGVIEDHNSDSNFCAYVATGVWHHVLVTGDRRFGEQMWPTVRAAIDFVLGLQATTGEIYWAHGPSGVATGSAADRLRQRLPQHPLRARPRRLCRRPRNPNGRSPLAGSDMRSPSIPTPSPRNRTTRWTGTTPSWVARCADRRRSARIAERWDEFVVDGLGIRCVDDRPWVTGAETCELVMALDAMGERDRALDQFAAMQHLREADGSYWTGLVFADGKRWPVERTTWTGAAVILAADALSVTTGGSGIFRAAELPRGLEGDYDCECRQALTGLPGDAASAPAPAANRSHRPR